MNLSKEQIKKILDEAPEGATHWWQFLCGDYIGFYGTYDEDISFSREMWNRMPLSDLRKQLECGRVNGDELYHTHHAYKVNPKITYVGKHPFIKGISYCISDMDGIITVDDCYISSEKPETEAEKAERERLESAYELYLEGQHSVDVIGYDSFDQFKLDKVQVKFWLAIVDKTNYRKQAE